MVNITEIFHAKQTELLVLLLGGRGVIGHPGEKGAATEENWRRMLRGYLPNRYQVTSGCVVDVDGNVSEQMDVLILDNQYTPVLFETGGVQYFPAESLYAAFEVKQDITKKHIEYAGAKLSSVRRLHRTSGAIPHAGGVYEPRPVSRIIGGLLATGSGWRTALGKSFEQSLLHLSHENSLDIGCVIEHGAFLVNRDSGHMSVTKSAPELSLVFFVLSLLGQLQAVGTVPAIDYGQWLRHARQSQEQ